MQPEHLAKSRVALYAGDCMAVLPALGANTIDTCVTDPPYHR